MKAVKGNKEYDIDQSMVRQYQATGFDIKNEDGEVVLYGKGKTVPYEEYLSLAKENEDLRKKVYEQQETKEDCKTELDSDGVKATQKKGAKKAGE